jgi:hypothetical protein
MAVYALIYGASATQTVAAVGSSTNPIATPQPTPGVGYGVGTGQAIQVTVSSASAGAISATVQPVGSNDGMNWVPTGSAITASGTASGSGISTFTAGAALTTPYAFFGAYVTAISGTGAKAAASINA